MLKQRLCIGAFSIFMAVVLVGCGGSGSGDLVEGMTADDELLVDNGLVVDDDSVVVVTESVTPAAGTVRYDDSKIRIDYPASWTVDTGRNGIVGFLSPDLNSSGGKDNCIVNSTTARGSTLVEFSDDFLSALPFTSEPTDRFTVINGTPAREYSGEIFSLGLIFPVQGLVFYDQETAFAIHCSGALSSEFRRILESVVIL